MIIDTIQVASLDAYFRHPGTGAINLADTSPVTVRSKPLTKGKQREITALHLLIEGADLRPLFNRSKPSLNPEDDVPLFSITVMKEMFPGLFADPFRHRVHNIAGFDDFKRGTLENGKVLDVEGIPTIVSMGTSTCKWQSPIYEMPEAVNLTAASWELATSRLTPEGSFTYSLYLYVWAKDQDTDTLPPPIPLATNYKPKMLRVSWPDNLTNVGYYQVVFEANVKDDSYIHEKHSPIMGESIGRPLLRAVNLLEPVKSVYDIYSLNELRQLTSDYHLFNEADQTLKKMLATLDLSTVLVFSDTQNTNDNDLSREEFEFIKLQIRYDKFDAFEAKLGIQEAVRISQSAL